RPRAVAEQRQLGAATINARLPLRQSRINPMFRPLRQHCDMSPGRFSFGNSDENQPRQQNGWFVRALMLAPIIGIAARAEMLDRWPFTR
ncbi:MAG: hypothetical protein ABSE69_16225, partial [Roseiarcus sp.]